MVKLCEVLKRPFIALAIDAADACNGGLCQARFLEGDWLRRAGQGSSLCRVRSQFQAKAVLGAMCRPPHGPWMC